MRLKAIALAALITLSIVPLLQSQTAPNQVAPNEEIKIAAQTYLPQARAKCKSAD